MVPSVVSLVDTQRLTQYQEAAMRYWLLLQAS